MMVQQAHTNRLTMLLANEQEGWHQTLRQLLQPQGVQTLSAHTGREVLDILQREPVHLVVLDVQMPQLGGLQVIKMMRDMDSQPPAILLANQLMQVFSVLSKPVDLNVLLDSIARVIKRHYASRWPT
jgi:DNA-binding response OmpR family regulator